MLKILNIIGARPQIIKASALSRAIKTSFSEEIEEIIVHTGQHYDHNMSEVFFEEMQIPKPHYNLNVGSASHARQTADILVGIEEIILRTKPDCVVLYGDTNSTVASSLAASKIHCPVVHIEAGLRSFNKSMPEEVNRIMCDHVSTLLFAPTQTAINNLKNEGFKLKSNPPFSMDNPSVYYCGDIMYDNSLYFSEIAEKKTNVLSKFNLEAEHYILVTIHRDNNTDDPKRLSSIFKAIHDISLQYKIRFIIPLHPRTKKVLEINLDHDIYSKFLNNPLLTVTEPASFLEMIVLEKNSLLIMTDSGGVQKESYFFKKPCIILRPETEWIELVELGTATIADASYQKITDAFAHYMNTKIESFSHIFGDGKASNFICEKIIENFRSK
jgi:UDP-GlcNAc3NAcA epimerase